MSLLLLSPKNKKKYFQATIKTDNLSTGSSTDHQFKLPLESSGTYNFVVDWGDGSKNTINVWNQAEVTHTYSAIGTYPIKIYGTLRGWRFNNGGDCKKILTIEHWGTNFELGNSENYFHGCENLTSVGNDRLQNPTMNSLYSAFRDCINFDSFLNIDTSNIIYARSAFFNCQKLNQSFVSNFNAAGFGDIGYMFYNNLLLNQDLSGWNIESVTNMTNILLDAPSWSRENYDKALISWANQNVQDSVQFACSSKYTLGGAAQTARTYLIDIKGWSISDEGGE